MRARINNLIIGVTDGFKKVLQIKGVGYRASMSGKALNLQLGYSHPISYNPPQGIQIACPSNDVIEISGYDKVAVGQVAADIRAYRPPEPYKGKGIRYEDEFVLRKEGKKK